MRQVFILAIAWTLRIATAAVIWIPEELDLSIEKRPIPRDTASSNVCASSLPSDFICPSDTTCLTLNTTASKAALCCPAGQDCTTIAPISCEQSLQNATVQPDSELHSDPTLPLVSCGSACCPMGYACSSGTCYAQSASSATLSTASSTSIATSTAVSSSSTTLASSSSSSAASTALAGSTADDPGSTSSQKFSGASFAAGFVPGIALGAFVAACLLLIFFRKHRGSPDSYINEKQSPRDTLTDLGTLSRRPTMHGRSISEPAPDPYAGHRTDFLRSTPPRDLNLAPNSHGYTVEATGPITPARTPKAVKALFSHSPFLHSPSTPASTQPPMPAHLKRGTLSFTVSPVRALKKQKSMHSLRRQMTEVSRSSSRRTRPETSRSGSTETIQVLMPSNDPYTPDQRQLANVAENAPTTLNSNAYRGPTDSASTWQTTSSGDERTPARAPYASSSRYPTQTFTPTRMPAATAEKGVLGTPYTPSRYYGNGNFGGGEVTEVLIGEDGGLRVVREPRAKRDTTFSAMMERAGLRRSDLIMGTEGRSARH